MSSKLPIVLQRGIFCVFFQRMTTDGNQQGLYRFLLSYKSAHNPTVSTKAQKVGQYRVSEKKTCPSLTVKRISCHFSFRIVNKAMLNGTIPA